MSDFQVQRLASDTAWERLASWDVVIIGAGPGGLAASLTTAHRGLTTLVIEAKDRPGGQPHFLYADKQIMDIPGFPEGISGESLSDRVYRQATDAQVQFRFQEELLAIEETTQRMGEETLKRVITNRASYLGRKVILACGLLHYPRRHPVLDSLESPQVFYRLPKSTTYPGTRVIIVGGGDSALDAGLMVQARGGKVTLVMRDATPLGKMDSYQRLCQAGAEVYTSAEIVTATQTDELLELQLASGKRILGEMVVVQIGFLASRETFARLNLVLNDDGSVAVDPYFETSRKGIFAVGDVHGHIKLIVVAWAEGIQAAIHAFKEIHSPYWLHECRLHDNKLALMGEKMADAAKHASPAEDA